MPFHVSASKKKCWNTFSHTFMSFYFHMIELTVSKLSLFEMQIGTQKKGEGLWKTKHVRITLTKACKLFAWLAACPINFLYKWSMCFSLPPPCMLIALVQWFNVHTFPTLEHVSISSLSVGMSSLVFLFLHNKPSQRHSPNKHMGASPFPRPFLRPRLWPLEDCWLGGSIQGLCLIFKHIRGTP